MTDSIQDHIIADLQAEADRIYEDFMTGKLTIIEAERMVASLDRKYTQRIVWEFIDVTPEYN